MKHRFNLLLIIFCFVFISPAMAEVLPSTVPEAVGFSSERLALIGTKLEADIAAGKIHGAVVLVARKGQIAYFEAFGMQDKEAGIPLKIGFTLSHLFDDQTIRQRGSHDAV